MSEWETLTLGDLCDAGDAVLQTGPFGSQLHSYDYTATGTLVIATEGIGHRKIIDNGLPRVPADVVARLARHVLRSGDILFARRGAQATGSSALVTKSHEGALCGTGAILLRTLGSRVDPAFLSFYLSLPSTVQWIRAHAVGAVMPNLNESVLRSLPLRIPSLSVQKTIAVILGALDDKIELNWRMNETLEAIARTLFKSWFIDFDPVRAKMAGRGPIGMDVSTAALFATAMTLSGGREIPAGWRVGRLDEVAECPRRGVQPSEVLPDTPYVGLEHMPRRSIALGEWGVAADVTSGKFKFTRGEILFGKLRPYFHKVGVAPIDGVCSTDILVLAGRTARHAAFALFHASSDELIRHVDGASTGTKMPRASWSDIARFEVALPPVELAGRFGLVVQPMLDRVVANIHESRVLAATRELLLPRLLFGQLRIRDVKRRLEEEL